MITPSEDRYQKIWKNSRFRDSPTVLDIHDKPFHEVPEILYCRRCSFHYRSTLGRREYGDMIEGYHSRHRRLQRRGYAPEFVEFNRDWLKQEFSDYIEWQPWFSFLMSCSWGGSFLPTTVHLDLSKKIPYIKKPHPDVRFFDLYDYLLVNYHSSRKNFLVSDDDAYGEGMTRDMRNFMEMTKEEFETEIALRDLAGV